MTVVQSLCGTQAHRRFVPLSDIYSVFILSRLMSYIHIDTAFWTVTRTADPQRRDEKEDTSKPYVLSLTTELDRVYSGSVCVFTWMCQLVK